MCDILANWISVGDSTMFERVELYSNQLGMTFEKFIPAPFGGPILIIYENIFELIFNVRDPFLS